MAEASKKGKAKAKPRARGKVKPKSAKPKRPAKAKGKRVSKPKAPAKSKAAPKPKAAGAPGSGGESKAASDLDEVAAATNEVPIGAGANAALAGKAALAGSRAAGRAVGVAVSKVKTPIVVGGGLIAGAAGGLALVRRRNGRSSSGALDVDRVIAAAHRAGSFGEELGRMASLMEQAGSKRK